MTEFNDGQCTYVATCITCAFLPLGCAFIPYMMDGLKDVVHKCRFCNTHLALYER